MAIDYVALGNEIRNDPRGAFMVRAFYTETAGDHSFTLLPDLEGVYDTSSR